MTDWPASPVHPPELSGFRNLAAHYDIVLSDVWGVVHDGVAAMPAACDALARFRAGGGRVVLITNAPRPQAAIADQIAALGAPRDCYDALATSGDVTLAMMALRGAAPVHHIGPSRDLVLFDELAATGAPMPPRVALSEATYVVCTGLHDGSEALADYDEALAHMLARGLTMICANPDIVVHVGHDLVYCAGAIAQVYEDMGGTVVQAGKPHPPIYDLALSLAGRKGRVLAIGDAIRTDVAGAALRGIDALLITQGIHRDVLHPGNGPLDRTALADISKETARGPAAIMPRLAW